MTTRAGPADVFDTASLRSAVLATWRRSPARFREDANAEELLGLGYGTRVGAELVANGADAARAAGETGRVALAVRDDWLCVANTGEPLSADGVAALASLRASAKRDGDQVGHFGVGFTAVRALADEIVIASQTGAVHFSAAETVAAIAGLGVAALDDEVTRRAGQVPALRLPWPGTGGDRAAEIPAGYVTEVRLRLRHGADRDRLEALLTDEFAEDLLWALPSLDTVIVPGYRVERARTGPAAATISSTPLSGESVAGDAPTTRRDYVVREATGEIPDHLLADRPTEERGRRRWRLTWVMPMGRDRIPSRAAVGAPTPTDEMLTLPARLIGTLPVEENRGRIAPGALTDFLVERAAEAYLALVLGEDPTARVALIPRVGLPAGDLDARLRSEIAGRLSDAPFLHDATDHPVRPGGARMVRGLSGPGVALLAEAIPGLIDWPRSADDVAALRSLGVREMPLAEVTAALASLQRPIAFWQKVYDLLADVPTDELADLPVPRPGGGTLIGIRDVVIPGSEDDGGLFTRAAEMIPGLRIAEPGIDHPLLRRLGARPAEPAALLSAPALDREITRRFTDLDHDDPDPADVETFAELVLDLAAEADPAAGVDNLANLVLTTDDGEPWPAGMLLLPDAALVEVLAPDADLPAVAGRWVTRYGRELLARIGVRDSFAVRSYPAPPNDDTDLPDVEDWWAEVGDAVVERSADADDVLTFRAVPDLDLVDENRWGAALAALASDPATRAAILGPTRRPGPPSYTAWWLGRFATIGGQAPTRLRTASADELTGLYDVAATDLDPDLLAALGVLTGLDDAAADPAELLGRWADPRRTVPAAIVPAVTQRLAVALADHDDAGGPEIDLPVTVRTVTGDVVGADGAVVLDRPDLAPLLDPATLVAGGRDPQLVAEVLGLETASQRCAPVRVATGHAPTPTPLGELPAARKVLQSCGRSDLADAMVTIDPELAVDGPGTDGLRRVRWLVDGDTIWSDGSDDSIGRVVAYRAGRWPDRHRLVAAARSDAVDLAENGIA